MAQALLTVGVAPLGYAWVAQRAAKPPGNLAGHSPAAIGYALFLVQAPRLVL